MKLLVITLLCLTACSFMVVAIAIGYAIYGAVTIQKMKDQEHE